MSVRSAYDPGVPCWVDLSTTDVAAAVGFYGELLGWRAEMAEDPAAGGYGQFYVGDKVVAGVGPLQNPGMPPVWNMYVSTDDAAAVADRVKNAGGTVFAEPFAVFEEGTMAVFQGPDGGFFCVWQPGNHNGAALVNEPGAFCWNELVSRDVDAATRFYAEVFGWRPHAQQMGEIAYTEWYNGEHSIAGMMPMGKEYPPQVPSYWGTYFAVTDLDATVAKAREKGATVLVDRMDAPPGVFAMLTDPQGASFNVIQLRETS
ncbi:VOC family protein [Nonomuraea endophytica]|uniref:VOC family protein n=1 Tax=Nonomuraea endophytica TaxID=714136 RepID=UPI0037C4FCD1